MNDIVIETIGLTRIYKQTTAVDGLNLSVPRGSVFGFLGPNGAGKTTTIHMLLGNTRPTSGSARLLGRPVNDIHSRRQVGFLPEKTSFYPFLTAKEFLTVLGRLSGMTGPKLRTRIEETLETVGLAQRGSDRISTYSRGMVQRLGLAQAIMHEPELIILDEPTSALDPLGRRDVRDIILQLKAKGCTVFINSHMLSEIEMTCDEVAILKAGKVIEAGKLNELLESSHTVDVEVDEMTDAAMAALRAVTLKIKFTQLPMRRFTAYVSGPENVPEIARVLVESGVKLLGMAAGRETLEELFVRVVEDK